MRAVLVIVSGILAASQKVLPGLYYVGDFVVSKIDHKDTNVKVRRGDLGHVIGRADVDPTIRMAVKFPDAPHINILPEQIQRVDVVIQCTPKGRCYIKPGYAKPEGGNSGSQRSSEWTVQSDKAASMAQFWQTAKYISMLLAALALGLRATVKPFFDRMEKERNAKKDREEKERSAKIAMQWVVEADYCCGVCEEPLLEPVTMACKHTLCQFCLKKWVATSAAHGAFKCPVGGACPNVPRLVPSVNKQVRDVVEARFPDRLQERRQELSAEQSEFGKSLCTQRLQEEIDASYVEKRAMDEDLLESLLEAGAEVNVRSIKFSDDTLLKVMLNSTHHSAETVFACAELLMNHGATLGEPEVDALLPWWATSKNRDAWEALGQQAWDIWDSARTKEIMGDLNVGDKVLVKANAHLQDGSWLRAGDVGGIVGPGETADHILVALKGGKRRVNMLPTEIEVFSDERAHALQASAQEPPRSVHPFAVHTSNSRVEVDAEHIRAFAESGLLPEHLVTHFAIAFSITEDAVRRIAA